jgi:hypothetical protein
MADAGDKAPPPVAAGTPKHNTVKKEKKKKKGGGGDVGPKIKARVSEPTLPSSRDVMHVEFWVRDSSREEVSEIGVLAHISRCDGVGCVTHPHRPRGY